MALRHITAVKSFSGCAKIILDAELVADMKLKFTGLRDHLI
jgi:hypothetical protein